MKRRVALGLISLGAAAVPGRAFAQMQMPMGSEAKIPPKPSAAEQPFITKLMDEMPKRYGTTAAATKAGYFQYTAEDSTGAISWVRPNLDTAKNFNDPSQLWYDVNGRLLGVDYTLETSQYAKPPATLFGYTIDASRYIHRGAHMHFGVKLPDGSMKYGGMAIPRFVEAGGNPDSTQLDLPQNKAALVKTGVAQSPDQVVFVFKHPDMWDMVVWVIPNPDGAFADANPNVKPSRMTKGAM